MVDPSILDANGKVPEQTHFQFERSACSWWITIPRPRQALVMNRTGSLCVEAEIR